jgi:hypothetical protein
MHAMNKIPLHVGSNTATCFRCVHHRKGGKGGDTTCAVDGGSIRHHAHKGDCPKGHHQSGGTIEGITSRGKPLEPWGPRLWRRLHTARRIDARWIRAFTKLLPCGDCRKHWRELLAIYPPVHGLDHFEWGWTMHNAINARLGKSEVSVEEARAKWLA